MTLRRAARRRRQVVETASLPARLLHFVTSWEGIIGLSVVLVLVTLAQGVLRLRLPFDLGQPPPPPDAWGYINVPRSTSIKLAYIGDVSGMGRLEDAGSRQGVELALKERAEIKGFKTELVSVEDTCDAEKAREKAQELAQDPQVVGVVSQACPASTVAQQQVLGEAKLPFLSLSNTSAALTAVNSPVTFRLLWNEKSQGRDAALYARQTVQAKRALLLHDGSPGADEILEEFRGQFRAQAGQIADRRPVDPAGSDWGAVLKEVQSLDVDLVYYAGGGKTAKGVLAFLRRSGYAGSFMVADGAYYEPEYQALGPDLEKTYATTLQGQRSARFAFWRESYEKEYGAVGRFSPEGYDAAMLLLEALDAAAKAKGDGSLEVGRSLLLGTMRSLPYEGITGRTAFDANGDRANMLINVWKYEDGQFLQVK
ncbi:MAG: branched-chain amino acid ABC transporter substrate-binding protein [Chloroflexi bacterium]|nr:branched-chain amino acid ABC transporter substrate-binding protein [Chloroflexota bacterium]